jgi:multicomponent Na+:H+ antiporter subunit E
MRKLFWKPFQAIGFFAYFLLELVNANLRVARDVVRPLRRLRPGIVAIPLDLETDAQITVLSTLITLTPGTLTLDVSTDRKTIYIHAMAASDVEKVRRDIKTGFERRVKALFS